MKRYSTAIKKFIFFTEASFIEYFGKNYESTVLHANHHFIPVIRIVNASGTRSAIPLERANNLLEKYYQLMDRQAKEVYHASLDKMAPVSDHSHPPVETPTEDVTLMSGAA